jgi:protein-tyrosine phosphatase
MLDIHSHILPEIDDGAKTIESTIEMLKIAREDGITKIVATPHYYRGYFETPYDKVCEYVKKLNATLTMKGITIEVIAGQEIFLDKWTLENLKNDVIGTIGNSSYMLVEFPMGELDYDALALIYELKLKGIRPIVAHPERYVYVIENYENINKFIDEECLFQINSGSLTGIYGKKVQKTAEMLIENGICNFVGSDAHSQTSRKPQIAKALGIIKNLNSEVYENINKNNELLLNNEIIECSFSKIKNKRGFFGMFKG